MNPSSRPSSVSDAKRSGSSGTALWIAIGVVVVLVGGLAVFLARGEGEDAPPIEDETAAVTLVEPAAGDGADLAAVQGGLPMADDAGNDPAVGMTIPTVRGTGIDGEPLTIAPDGTPKVLVFMAHWCPHCQAEIPRLVEHFADDGVPEGVDVIGISTRVDTAAPNYPPSAWLEDESWDLPTLVDSQAADAFGIFGVSGFPYFIAVDAEGTVVARTSGELPPDVFDQLVGAARTGAA